MDTSKQKPELMSAPHSGQDQSQRILASLEYGGKPVTVARTTIRQLDSWIVGVSSLVLILAALAWATRNSANAPVRQPPALPPNMTTPSRPAAPAAISREPQDSQAAAIITEPAAADHQAARGTPTTSAGTEPATRTVPVPELAAQHKAPSPHVAAPPAHPTTIASAATRNSSNAGATAAHSATPSVTASADTDVTLLTALVAHAGTPAAVTPERSRDVVERREGDSTEALLLRCKQLGLIEGMLCRSRICSGRWDSDAACRAPSH